MLPRLLVLVLLSSLALGQTSTSKPQPPPQKAPAPQAQPAPAPSVPSAPRPSLELRPAAPRPEDVAPNVSVITIPGLCDKPTPGKGEVLAECKTEVTRAEFEKVADAIAPQLPPGAKRQLAVAYARLLTIEKVARDRNLLNEPRTLELIRLARLQALAQALQRRFQEEAAKTTPQEIEEYYRAHPELWEEVTLGRVYVPRGGGPGNASPPDEAALKSLADKLRQRAAAGEKLDTLQKEAWTAAGIKSEPPPTQAGTVRRASLPPSQASVFDLKPGEVSQPISETGGYYIYKLESRQTIALEKAKPEIENRLRNERFQSEAGAVTRAVQPTLNDAYFGPPAPGEGGAPPRPEAGSATPPQGPPPQKPPQPQ